jgi:bifunctional non-homologous end joining protein LigD
MTSGEGHPVTIEMDGFSIPVNYPNKILWKKSNITKIEMVNYYKTVSVYMFSYLKNRPVTLHYYPRGIDNISFYKRNFKNEIPGLISIFPYREISRDKTIQVPIISSRAGIVYLAAKACVAFHSWSSTIAHIQQPDIAVFDLDISGKEHFDKVLDAARLLYEFLQEKQIKSFVKTSGGSGLHVYVPINPVYDFHTVKDWVKQVALLLSKRFPKTFTTAGKSNKTHSSDKVVIDYMQNIVTRNTATVYTVRGFEAAPVSCPVSWDEIYAKSFLPSDFTIKSVPERLHKKGDLFAGLLSIRQDLPRL